MVLDVEDIVVHKQVQPPMTVEQVEAFVRRVYEVRGRYPGIYAGNEHLTRLSVSEFIVENCWVWLTQYRAKPTMPRPWLAKGEDWTLWQYTDGTMGPLHDTINGVPLDHEEFNGTQEELMTFWRSNTA